MPMDGIFNNSYTSNQEESENTSDNSGESPFSGALAGRKMASASSQRRSRRALHKRIVTVPLDGCKSKGDGSPPPYDSWAWRKYGQKPIKGSPYPRGYYRCSSSKGCPARKQVERSRVDSTMLVITYACDHNHSGSPSRKPASVTTRSLPISSPTSPKSKPDESAIFSTQTDSLITSDDFLWLSDVASTSAETILESPIYSGISAGEADMAMLFPIGEEDELFADLGELPECSVVFERGFLLDQEARGRCGLRAG